MSALDKLDLNALLDRLAEQDVRLTADGALLRYDAPATVAGPALEEALRRHKASLLSWAAGEPVVVARERAGNGAAEMVRRHASEAKPETWNISVGLDLRGPLVPAALTTALTELIARHEALRSRFRVEDDTVWQEVFRADPRELPVEDLRDLLTEVREARVEEVAEQLSGPPFDLAVDARPRIRLLRLGEEEWRLVLVMHHATCDGQSFSVMLRELTTLYRQECGEELPALPPAPSCTEHARAEAARAPDAAEVRSRLAFWARELADIPEDSGLPPDRPRTGRPSGRGDTERLPVSPRVRAALEAFARRHGTTPFAVTLASTVRMVAELSGRTDIALSTSYADRPDPSAMDLVSCTATALPLRIRLDDEASFAALCHQVHSRMVEGIAHLLPFGRVKEGLARDYDQQVRPLPLSMTYQNSLDTTMDLPGVTMDLVDLHPPSSRRDCSFAFVPLPDGSAELSAEYSTDLYDARTARGWLEDITARLAALEEPGRHDTAAAG